MSPQIISLTTDFGAGGEYVGALKGVLLGINPGATIVDITHHIPPQDVAHGAFVWGSACGYFPSGAVHVGVVDPGVGTPRRAILLITPSGHFLAPDNGMLTYLLRKHGAGPPPSDAGFMEPVATRVPEGCRAFSLTRREYWLETVSDTFHGRDIFAPVAAHVSMGVAPEALGEPVEELTALNIMWQAKNGDTVEGRIIFVDHFGNLVTNVDGSLVRSGQASVEVAGAHIEGMSRTFSDGEGLVALVGSHGYLEIAQRNGSAARRLSAGVGSEVRVTSIGAC